MTTPAKRETPINLRALPAQRALIDRARQLTGKSRTEFVLEAACREAENTLLDQRLFLLDEERFAAFEEALDAPVKDNPALRKLLTTPAPWD
ncbi:type II toxin-antitoxin system TacA family antitoxin [Thiohalorhabdus sp.]|uniref:type II toxin-antitoxin system TacA family antitoxin n=2 Tax=Thiohalorhabdus sp. TaxID=3094134 RepID=UPI002FC3A685